MRIHEIFSSIQGEGSNTGLPMTFVRMYGCNLRCPGCDTPQDDYSDFQVSEILNAVSQYRNDWVCITGGEPTYQNNELLELVGRLRTIGYKIALETNGLIPPPEGFHWVVCSPKYVWPDSFDKVDEIKLVVGSGMYNAKLKVRDNLDTWNEQHKVVCVQPWWNEDYQTNLKEAIKIAQSYQVRLSIQLHKYLEVK